MNIPPIIGFAGKKQSGKDTALAILRQLYPNEQFIKIAFADSVKKEIAHATGQPISMIEKRKSEFRPILQWWGTDFRRNMCSKDYWVNYWLKKVGYIKETHRSVIIVATDVRFQNEVDAIHTMGGECYSVEVGKRQEALNIDHHESEMLNLCNLDGFIHNDMGEQFKLNIKQLTEKEWK